MSRACTSVALDPFGRTLAVGLDKHGRDFGLQVFDVERSVGNLGDGSTSMSRSVSLRTERSNVSRPLLATPSPDVSSRTLAHSPAKSGYAQTPPPSGSHTEHSAIAQSASTEGVNSVVFTTATPSSHYSVLLAAVGGKSIRLFDLRAAAASTNAGLASVSQWPTRSALGIEPDPFSPFRFASFGDDGAVRIWDTRRANESLLMFSEEQAGVKAPPGIHAPQSRSSKTNPLGAVTSIAWSRTQPGTLAMLTAESSALRLWSIVSNSHYTIDTHVNGHASAVNPLGTPTEAHKPVQRLHQQLGEDIPSCSLFTDVLTRPGGRPLQTMIAANFADDPARARQSFLGVSRDGHISILEHRQSGTAVLGARGETVYSTGANLRLQPSPALPLQTLSTANGAPPSHQRSPSAVQLGPTPASGSRRGRPSGTATRRPALRARVGSSRSLKSFEDSDDSGAGLARQVRLRIPAASAGEDADRPSRSDVAHVMIERVHAGCGLDVSPSLLKLLPTPKLTTAL